MPTVHGHRRAIIASRDYEPGDRAAGELQEFPSAAEAVPAIFANGPMAPAMALGWFSPQAT